MLAERSLSVDIAKGIAIIAIVLGHINYDYPKFSLVNAHDLIYLWHVPVFFILGGFFIKEKQLLQPWKWFKKKFLKLYLKILYFYIPAVLLHNVFIKIGWYSTTSTNLVINSYTTIDFLKQIVLVILCAGREPILGAMWFVYVLFMALIGISIISWLINKFFKDKSKSYWIRFIVLLALTIVFGIVSNKYGITLKRFSNVFTAMLLIDIGWIMNRKLQLKYDNGYFVVICAMLAFEIVCMLGGVELNGNAYKDITQLVVAAPAVLYCIMFFAKKIEHSVIGKGLAKAGYDSFYIMALHFVGFKFCTMTLNVIGLGGVNCQG